MKKVLIFHSLAGAGHLIAAQAIEEEIKVQSPKSSVKIVDGLVETSFGFKTDPVNAYRFLSNNAIEVFNLAYQASENSFGVKSLNFLVKKIFGKVLEKEVKDFEPDLIVSTHFALNADTTGAANLKIPFVMVVTDLGSPHLVWFDSKADAVITPNEEIAQYAHQKSGIPLNKFHALGYPIKDTFSKLKPNSKLTNNLLVLGGGVGSGGLKEKALYLAGKYPDKKIVVVCGNNHALKEELINLNLPNLEVIGFTKKLAELMDESDIIITKAGPGTIMEAAVMGKPLIITSWVGLQEKDNADFVIENSLGLYSPTLSKLGSSIEKIYSNYSDYSKGNLKFKSGTEEIVKFLMHFF